MDKMKNVEYAEKQVEKFKLYRLAFSIGDIPLLLFLLIELPHPAMIANHILGFVLIWCMVATLSALYIISVKKLGDWTKALNEMRMWE